MTLYFSYDPQLTIQSFLKELLNNLDIPYSLVGAFEIHLKPEATPEQTNLLIKILDTYKISVIKDPKVELVHKVKSAIHEMVWKGMNPDSHNTSFYLSNALDYSYAHLSKIFSEVTHSSIEHYVILQRIEFVKYLMIEENLNLTEISHRMDYCSVAHLSRQFKETTGLTFSAFQRILKKRNIIKQSAMHQHENAASEHRIIK